MAKKIRNNSRREDSLSRDLIIDAAIDLLDTSGESGLTFRALSERLATGAGAIYWHIANRNDLLTAACDTIVACTIESHEADITPEANIRSLALRMFDAIDRHPWVSTALIHAAGQLPIVRILECVGQQVRALGVSSEREWAAASTLLHYILGVAGQNAANSQTHQPKEADRSEILNAVADTWTQLDPDAYPFTRKVAEQLRTHDDREDFLAGIDLILIGIKAHQ